MAPVKSKGKIKKLKMVVLDLKVLATREVLRRGLDFSDHLAGRTRQELEDLETMAGIWKVENTDLLVERCNGDLLTVKENEKLLYELPTSLLTFLASEEETMVVTKEMGSSGSWVEGGFRMEEVDLDWGWRVKHIGKDCQPYSSRSEFFSLGTFAHSYIEETGRQVAWSVDKFVQDGRINVCEFLRYEPFKADALMVKETFGPVGMDQMLWTYKLANYEQNYMISRNTLAVRVK